MQVYLRFLPSRSLSSWFLWSKDSARREQKCKLACVFFAELQPIFVIYEAKIVQGENREKRNARGFCFFLWDASFCEQIQWEADCLQEFFKFSNPQKITCIIFENLFVPYFLPHQSHSYGYAPSSGENLIQIWRNLLFSYYFKTFLSQIPWLVFGCPITISFFTGVF